MHHDGRWKDVGLCSKSIRATQDSLFPKLLMWNKPVVNLMMESVRHAGVEAFDRMKEFVWRS